MVNRTPHTVRLSVVIPAYNEEATITQIIKEVLKQKQVWEIVVINDASTDRTKQLLEKIKKTDARIRVFHSETNGGKGSAIRKGIELVAGTHLLIQDADLEYEPAEIPQLLKPIQQGKATVVYGSRFMGPHTNMYFWHYVGNIFLNFLVNVMFNTTLSDMETCYKIVPIETMREMKLRSNDFRIEPEITCKLLLRGHRIYETPISYVGRTFEEGKKIGWFDAVLAIQTIFAIRVGLMR